MGITLMVCAALILFWKGGSSETQRAADRIGESTPETSESRATLVASIGETNKDIGWLAFGSLLVVGALCVMLGSAGLVVALGIWVGVVTKVLS